MPPAGARAENAWASILPKVRPSEDMAALEIQEKIVAISGKLRVSAKCALSPPGTRLIKNDARDLHI